MPILFIWNEQDKHSSNEFTLMITQSHGKCADANHVFIVEVREIRGKKNMTT